MDALSTYADADRHASMETPADAEIASGTSLAIDVFHALPDVHIPCIAIWKRPSTWILLLVVVPTRHLVILVC